MSTGTSWTSCMNLDTGCYNEHVPLMIDNGALAAYVVDMDDPANTKNGKPFLGNPLKRILAVPVTKDDDFDEHALWVVDNQYPKETPAIPAFKKAVENWIYGKQGFVTEPSRWFIDTEIVYDDNYRYIGKRKGEVERPPFKLELDEGGYAAWMLSDNFEDFEYLNRQPDEDEYDDYYEEAHQNVEVSVYSYDRLLRELFDIFEHEVGKKYSEVEDRMQYVVGDLKGGHYEMDADSAKDAIYDYYKDLDEKFMEDYYETAEEDKPDKKDYEHSSPDQYQKDLEGWERDIIESFCSDYEKQLKFAEYFMEEFPYNFKFEVPSHRTSYQDHPDQLKLNFEGRVNTFTKLFKLFG
jgi:hypothetical protein